MKKFLYALGLALALFAQSANAQLYFLEDTNGNYYSVNPATGAATLITTIGLVTSSTIGLSEGPGGTMFASTWTDLISFNADGTGAVTIGPSTAEAMAWCSGSNILYSGINGAFSSVNQATGVKTALAAPAGDVEGLACDNVNNLVYGLEANNPANLYRYTPGTNSWALVGNTGLNVNAPGLAMDSASGILYAVTGGNLYRISPTTAVATLVGPTGVASGGGLAFAGAAAGATAVPTLSEWGMMVLSILLAVAAYLTLRRRRL